MVNLHIIHDLFKNVEKAFDNLVVTFYSFKVSSDLLVLTPVLADDFSMQ